MRRGLHAILRIAIVLIALTAFHADLASLAPPSVRLSHFPHLILWAWERPEDLSFLDADKTAVAFLAVTLELSGDSVWERPRMQPLKVPAGTKLIAVARVEVGRRSHPSLSARQWVQAAGIIANLTVFSPATIQVDFDATRSQRAFYRGLLIELRRRLPASLPLSITALASWCLDDDWIDSLPVDEAVPVLYRMGPERDEIEAYVRAGGSFTPPIARDSVGVSFEKKIQGVAGKQRVYVFSAHAWTRDAANEARREAGE